MSSYFNAQIIEKLIHCTIVIGLLTIIGCSSANRKQPAVTDNKPKIKSVVDIGSMPFNPKIKQSKLSDSRFSPGEKIIIEGNNLKNVSINLDGVLLNSIEQTASKIVFYLPAKMLPFEKHQLKLTNDFGEDKWVFNSSHYLVGSDTDGNLLHFIRSNPDEKGGYDKDILEVEQTRVLFNLISNDGAFAFTIGVESKTNALNDILNNNLVYGLALNTVHLNQAKTPKIVNKKIVQLNSTPISASIDQNGHLLILGKRGLLLIDVKDPLNPVELASLELPESQLGEKTTYVDAVLFADSKKIAVIEAYSNKVVLVNISPENILTIESETILISEKNLPLLVDLEVDQTDSNKLWVLVGPNLRQLGKKIYNEFDDTKSSSIPEKIVAVALVDNKLAEVDSIVLPDNFVPFFLSNNGAENLYVSGIHSSFFDYDEEDDWKDKIKRFVPMLLKSVKFGSVLTVNKSTQKVETLVEGVGIYYNVTAIPGKGPAFSLLKLDGSMWFPFVKVAWGMGIEGRGTYSIRSLDNHFMLPPYSLGYVSFQ